jgi:hypothetical protein
VAGWLQQERSPNCPFSFVGGSTRIFANYKNNRIFGKVSPYAMALASPVWNKFGFPPFRILAQGTATAKESETTNQPNDSAVPKDVEGKPN